MKDNKHKIQASMAMLFGVNLIRDNIEDTKGTFLYRSKLEKEINFSYDIFNRILDKTSNPDAAKMERFAAMNRIFGIIGKVLNRNIDDLETIEQLLLAFDKGEIIIQD